MTRGRPLHLLVILTLLLGTLLVAMPLSASSPGAPSLAPLVDWSDNFDSYATGSQLHGQGGWKGWGNVAGGGALTSNAQAHSAPNSAAILGASDLVHEYAGYTTGQWIYTAWQYVPTNFTGETYFILLNQYNDAQTTLNWSTQISFDAVTNLVTNDGAAGGTATLVKGQWVELRNEIDLVANTQTFYYNGALLFTGSWTEGMSGGGILNIAAVDLYANNATVVYYDDISLVEDVVAAPAITLTKTVGTVPGVCATTDNITVPGNTSVYYCYQVQNTGSVAFNFHDLEDSELGTLYNNFPLALAPGATSPPLIVPQTVNLSVTNVATWTAVTDIGGYTYNPAISYNWQDISGTGTAVTLSDDEVSAALPIGFSFDFYGTGYSSVYASSNGFLTFLAGQYNGCCSGLAIPTAGDPDGLVVGWWEDMNPSAGGTHHYQTLGSAPNRVFIWQVTNVPHYGGGNLVTLQYKLYEGTNVIEVHYQAAPSDGGTHSAGIENQGGTIGVQHYFGTAPLTAMSAVQYAPAVVQSATSTDSATVTVVWPNIFVDPLSLSSTQLANTSVMQTLTISNTGLADLTWNIIEGATVPAAQQPADARSAAVAGWSAPVHFASPDDILIDEGFEGGVMPPAGWERVSANPGFTWKIMTLGTPHSGTYSADVEYDPALVPQDEWLLSPEMTLSGGTLSFWSFGSLYWCRDTYDNCDLNVWLVVGAPGGGDDIFVGEGDTVWPANWVWAQSTFDLSALVPATPVRIGFEYTGIDGAQIALDDILLDGTLGTACTGDIPWLATSPVSGTTASGLATDVNVTFNSTGLATGTYTGTLCIASNDPDTGPGNQTELVIVPVELIVRPPTAVSLTSLTAAGGSALPLVAVPVALLAVSAALWLRRKR